MITQESIQKVLDTAQVEEVVQEFVQLKRAGVNFKGLCPFHDEKTPSFVVSPAKNLYKCFGCGKGGSPVSFLMEHEQMSYPEALRYLADKYNIELEETGTYEENQEEKQRRDSLFIVNEFARQFYENQLFDTDRGRSVGLAYFTERGYSRETLQTFGLGYAPPGPTALTDQALQKGYQKEFLQNLGLTSQYDKDFFRDRVIFPIHNTSGKVVAFAGRILQKKAKAPKYINSPESEIYHKSRVLYGLHLARKAIRKADECILVEGYTDVISLHQAGIERVVASSGTSLTEGQVHLVKRLTPNVTMLYDGDTAGVKAALRGVDIILEQDMNVKVVLLPDGEDPDSFVRKVGKTDFQKYLSEEARDFIFFKADLLLAEAGNDPVKKAAGIKEIVDSISRVPDTIKRALYIKECAQLLDIEEQALTDQSNRLITERMQKAKRQARREVDKQTPASQELPTSRPEKKVPETRPMEVQEREIVRILICFGREKLPDGTTVAQKVAQQIREVADEFDHILYGKVVHQTLQILTRKGTLPPHFFTEHPEEDIRKLAVDLLQSPYTYSENWEKKFDVILQTQKMPEENFEKDAQRVLLGFKLEKFKLMCQENQQFIGKLQAASEQQEKLLLRLKVQQELYQRRDAIARELGVVILG